LERQVLNKHWVLAPHHHRLLAFVRGSWLVDLKIIVVIQFIRWWNSQCILRKRSITTTPGQKLIINGSQD
jgi:hypothetical protein